MGDPRCVRPSITVHGGLDYVITGFDGVYSCRRIPTVVLRVRASRRCSCRCIATVVLRVRASTRLVAVVLNDRMEYFVDVDDSVGSHCSKRTQK